MNLFSNINLSKYNPFSGKQGPTNLSTSEIPVYSFDDPKLLDGLYEKAKERYSYMVARTIRGLCDESVNGKQVYICGNVSGNREMLLLQLYESDTSSESSKDSVRIQTYDINIEDAIACILNEGKNCKKSTSKKVSAEQLQIVDDYLKKIAVENVLSEPETVWFVFTYKQMSSNASSPIAPYTELKVSCLFDTLYNFLIIKDNTSNKIKRMFTSFRIEYGNNGSNQAYTIPNVLLLKTSDGKYKLKYLDPTFMENKNQSVSPDPHKIINNGKEYPSLNELIVATFPKTV